MSRVVAIGEVNRVGGFAMVGVEVCATETPADVHAAWNGLAADVGLVLLTPAAAAALGVHPDADGPEARPDRPLTVVLPP